MCRLIENNCKILQIGNSWPAEFNCENETLYPPKQCKVNFELLYFFYYIYYLKHVGKYKLLCEIKLFKSC